MLQKYEAESRNLADDDFNSEYVFRRWAAALSPERAEIAEAPWTSKSCQAVDEPGEEGGIPNRMSFGY